MANGNGTEKDEPESRQTARQGWLWSRGSSSSPASTDEQPPESQPQKSSPSRPTSQNTPAIPDPSSSSSSSLPSKHSTPLVNPADDPRLDTSRKPPADLPKLEGGKLDPSKFQTNFPQDANPGNGPGGAAGEPPTVTGALKSIKPEDFLTVTQTPCARNGFIAGIISGGLVGGVRFMMRTPLPKVAHWSVGGTILGAAASFEYCQYQRRQEKFRMRRAVEVYQEEMADKRRREYQERAAAKDEAEAAEAKAKAGKSWWKVW